METKEGGDDLRSTDISTDGVKDKEEEIDKIMDNVKTQEKKILTTAKTKADTIIKESQVEAENEKKGILGNIEKLRDKAKEIISGQDRGT